jgi:hypothetical protein
LHVLLVQHTADTRVDSAYPIQGTQGGLYSFLYQELGRFLDVPNEQDQLYDGWPCDQYYPVHSPIIDQREEKRDSHCAQREEDLHKH